MYNVIIADDAQMNRRLIKNILNAKLKDLVIFEAENGQEVLKILETATIHLILLDLIMPVMDGFETLKRLKSDKRTHDIPVIVNSAITEIKSIEKTLAEGAIDYFTKPFSPNDMTVVLPLKAKNALIYYEQTLMIQDLNRKINEELKNANVFQTILLPESKNLETVDLTIRYEPSLGIGGDFFDCVEEDGKVWFMIADVTGHGIAAGMASSMIKILFRKAIENNKGTPANVLEGINNSIFKIFNPTGKHNYLAFTGFLGCIEKDQLSYSNAGQPYPVFYKREGMEMRFLENNGFMIGMLEGLKYDTHYLKVESGDALFLYTDGLFSAGSSKDFTNWGQVLTLAKRYSSTLEEDPESFLESIIYAFHLIHRERKTDFTDDVALMLLQIH